MRLGFWLIVPLSLGSLTGALGASPDGVAVRQAQEMLERILTENILPFWYPQTLDQEFGGYRLNHDEQGRWRGPADKALVTQARTVWFFAHLARSPYGKPEHLEAARHGYRFLRDKMWDREHGGFYWAVDAAGDIPTRPLKHLYGQSFALYALSEYALATDESEPRQLAQALFQLLECKAHDAIYGGYREFFQRDWTPVPEGTPSYMGGAPHPDTKLMNTHLHLMEALTTYVLATHDPLARERLLELIRIQSNAVVRKDLGACTDKYQADWTPLRGPAYDRVSYGHDIENVWLLIEACAAAGISNGPLLDLYRTLFDYSLRTGYDAERGGFYDSGPFNQPADRRQKTWWVQAECLVSALTMYMLTREERYWTIFDQMLDWIVRYQVDWEHGDWHADVLETGEARGSKAGPWKSPYHNGRAVLQCLKLLRQLAAEGR